MEKVKVIKDACIGCGSCSAIAPTVFTMGDDGFAEIIKEVDFETVSEEIKNDVMDAVDGCPTGALELIEDEEK